MERQIPHLQSVYYIISPSIEPLWNLLLDPEPITNVRISYPPSPPSHFGGRQFDPLTLSTPSRSHRHEPFILAVKISFEN